MAAARDLCLDFHVSGNWWVIWVRYV